MRNPRVLCNIQATRPRACACIFHLVSCYIYYLAVGYINKEKAIEVQYLIRAYRML